MPHNRPLLYNPPGPRSILKLHRQSSKANSKMRLCLLFFFFIKQKKNNANRSVSYSHFPIPVLSKTSQTTRKHPKDMKKKKKKALLANNSYTSLLYLPSDLAPSAAHPYQAPQKAPQHHNSNDCRAGFIPRFDRLHRIDLLEVAQPGVRVTL